MSAASPLDAGAVAAANASAPGILPASGRLALIDGLRGIAAMLVVLFHFCAVAHLADVPVLGWLFAHGNFGVEVFFVISGFVIAYSVRNAQHTLPFLGRFALRRS